MSSSVSKDATDDAATLNPTNASGEIKNQGKNWVQFDDESPPETPATLKPLEKVGKLSENNPVVMKSDSVAVNVEKIGESEKEMVSGKHKTNNEYSGAVLVTESVHINLDRSGLNRSISSEGPDLNLPSDVRVSDPKSASLKTIDLRDASNGRLASSNIVSTPIGNIRQGFANGDTIVTLLPVNTKWPWITPAKFRPELVPEELMAQGLTLTVEDYVHIMELLVNDVRFNMYNICYKRILVLWIFTAFIVLLGLLFSGVTGLTLFGLGVMWLVLNAAAIFFCMFVKIKLNHNLEKCMAQVNKHLLRHKILLGLDDRGKISCHKVNLCFIYFDTADCILAFAMVQQLVYASMSRTNAINKKLQEVIEREEREGRIIGGDEAAESKRRQDLQQRMDIDDNDIVIQGSTTTRVSRKQGKGEQVLRRYVQRWAKDFLRRRLDWTVDEEGGNPSCPRHSASALCPCQYVEEWLRNKPRIQGRDFCPAWSGFLRDRGYPPGFTWCAYLSDPAVRANVLPDLNYH